MEFSTKQQAALSAVDRWLAAWRPNSSPVPQVFRLFGYAGSGKTTLARHFAAALNGRVLYAAYTGKAALVLQEKGCQGASTIHRLIYRPKDKSAARLHALQRELAGELDPTKQVELQKLIKKENENLSRPAFQLNTESEIVVSDLLVIDEVSMVGRQMGEDLLSFEKPILVLGDTAQLPPVADGGYFTNNAPDVMLDEIHRQASGSPVIELATQVRLGQGIDYGVYESDDHPPSRVIHKGILTPGDLSAFDQILVGRNATRKVVNDRIRREVLGRKSHLPEPGDKLVCLRNNHENGLLNGSLWDVLDCSDLDEDTIGLTVYDPTWKTTVNTVAHKHHFEGREKDMPWFMKREADEFDFGYALTVHKAQGSQWGNVCVVDESQVFRQDAARWLYTGVTRAAHSVTVVR